MIIAGGGAGGANGTGGAAGCPQGSRGSGTSSDGTGGTQPAGGTGSGSPAGGNGSALQGGTGGLSGGQSGGGGGGGLFGGASGGLSAGLEGGGGGGSCFFVSGVSATSSGTNGSTIGNGQLSILYTPGTPTIAGTNFAGKVTENATVTTTTITFNGAGFVAGVSCGISLNNFTSTYMVSPTATSSILITVDKAFGVGNTFNYWCLGY